MPTSNPTPEVFYVSSFQETPLDPTTWRSYLLAFKAMLLLSTPTGASAESRTAFAAKEIDWVLGWYDEPDMKYTVFDRFISYSLIQIKWIAKYLQLENVNYGTKNGVVYTTKKQVLDGVFFQKLWEIENVNDFLHLFDSDDILQSIGWARQSIQSSFGSTIIIIGDSTHVESLHLLRTSVTGTTASSCSDVAKITCSKSDNVSDTQVEKKESVSVNLNANDDTVLNPIPSVLDNGRVQSASVSDHAKLKRESVSEHAKLKRESVSDYAKIKRESVSDHAKIKKPIKNSTVSTVATTDAYGEYFKYRYDEKSAKNTSNVNDVESVSKAIRAVNIRIAVCDSTTTKSQAHSRSAYDDMSDNANYYKYRYDEKQLTGYSDTTFETESNSTQNCYESFQDENTHYVVDHHNGTIAEFDPDAYAPDRYEHIVENDTAYVVDHYNEEIYKDFGCNEEDCNSYFDHSSLHNYEYYTDDDSHGEESYWSDDC